MVDQHSSVRAAVSQALDDIGLAPNGDDEIADDFIVALKEYGFVIVREENLTGGEQ
jgi:hypothetical protein